MAEDTKQPISAPSDGQIALTAHNNGDGTWAVKRGPGGAILEDGLAREKALAIVGGATGPYEPANAQEEVAAKDRAAAEAKAAEIEEAEALKSDEDLKRDPLDHDGDGKKGGFVQPDAAAGARKAASNTENAKAKNGGE